MELMGQDSIVGCIRGQFKRFSQINGPYEINFKKDLPMDTDVYISIDGENFIMRGA